MYKCKIPSLLSTLAGMRRSQEKRLDITQSLGSINYQPIPLQRRNHDALELLQYLHPILFFCPLWIFKSPNNNHVPQRTNSLNWILFIIFGLASVVPSIYLAISDVIGDVNQHQGIEAAYYISEMGLIVIGRFFAMWHFAQYFDYPWLKSINSSIHFTLLDESEIYKMVKYNIYRISFYLFITIIMDCGHCTMNVSLNLHENKDDIYNIIANIVKRIFLMYPQFVTIAVCSMIFIKYKLYLLAMEAKIKTMQTDNNNQIECGNFFKSILTDYVAIKNEFNNEYGKYLRYFILLNLGSLSCDIWINAFDILQLSDWFNINSWNVYLSMGTDIAIFFEFMIAASSVTESFTLFERALYHQHWLNKSTGNDYLKLQNYIRKYPLVVSVSGMRVTKKNGIKLLCVFILTKLISYSIYSIGSN